MTYLPFVKTSNAASHVTHIMTDVKIAYNSEYFKIDKRSLKGRSWTIDSSHKNMSSIVSFWHDNSKFIKTETHNKVNIQHLSDCVSSNAQFIRPVSTGNIIVANFLCQLTPFVIEINIKSLKATKLPVCEETDFSWNSNLSFLFVSYWQVSSISSHFKSY